MKKTRKTDEKVNQTTQNTCEGQVLYTLDWRRAQAEAFLRRLTGLDTIDCVPFHFTCFRKDADVSSGRPRNMVGTLAEHFEVLVKLNADGYSIHVAVHEKVNPFSGGRKRQDFDRPRAVINDADGGYPDRLPLTPSIVVVSSPGKSQLYWTADDLTWDAYEDGQACQIAHHGCDPKVRDRARVLKLPGFHNKKPAYAPHFPMVRLDEELATGVRCTNADLVAAFPAPAVDTVPAKSKRAKSVAKAKKPAKLSTRNLGAVATYGEPPVNWIERSPNRGKIEALIAQFRKVEQHALSLGGAMQYQEPGHDLEVVDINQTRHWFNCLGVIIDALGQTADAYWLHLVVSRGDAALGLRGGPETYDAEGNWTQFRNVTDAATFKRRQNRHGRTEKSARWWCKLVDQDAWTPVLGDVGKAVVSAPEVAGTKGQATAKKETRKQANTKATFVAAHQLKQAGVAANVALIRKRLPQFGFKAGTIRHQVIDFVLARIDPFRGLVDALSVKAIAAALGVKPGTVDRSIREGVRAGVLIRSRGSEGPKKLILTAPVTIGVVETAPGSQQAQEPQWMVNDDFPGGEPLPTGWAHGQISLPQTDDDKTALADLCEDAKRGRATAEPLLVTDLLPPLASSYLIQNVEREKRLIEKAVANRKPARVKEWSRLIATEIGLLLAKAPNDWTSRVDNALDNLYDDLSWTTHPGGKGQPTAAKWGKAFAEWLGVENIAVGNKMTPMAAEVLKRQAALEAKTASKVRVAGRSQTTSDEADGHAA